MSGLGLTFLRRGGQAHPTAGSDYILSEKRGDPEVFRILMSNGVSSDGVGITKEDMARMTNVSGFTNNKLIVSFDEFEYCTSIKTLSDTVFANCTNLASIKFPPSLTKLTRMANNGSFYNCDSLTSVVIPGLESVDGWSFQDCSSLAHADFGENFKALGWRTFQNCPMRTLIIRNPTPAGMGDTTLTTSCNIYVPDEAVEAYKASSAWSSRASRIKGISEYQR